MSQEPDSEVAVQREVARIALAGVEGFALAGSGAIREHGIIDRPTEDVDLFTTSQDVTGFHAAVNQVSEQLRAHGFTVAQTRQTSQYARLHVAARDGLELDVDLGVDWRQDDPVGLDVGPVLSLGDAVGNKVGALYSRGEARDYLDVDAIRASGRFSDDQLLVAAAERDPGFDAGMFAWRLRAAAGLSIDDVERYGVTADQLVAVTARCVQWAGAVQEQADREHREGLSSDGLRGLIERRQAGFPAPAADATGARADGPEQAIRRPAGLNRGIER